MKHTQIRKDAERPENCILTKSMGLRGNFGAGKLREKPQSSNQDKEATNEYCNDDRPFTRGSNGHGPCDAQGRADEVYDQARGSRGLDQKLKGYERP